VRVAAALKVSAPFVKGPCTSRSHSARRDEGELSHKDVTQSWSEKPLTPRPIIVGCRANLRQASGNLPWVDVLPAVGANVYSILQRDYLLLSRDAVATLTERGSRFIHRKPKRLRAAAAEAAARL
jgi:Ribosomal protein L4/L1 family